MNSDSLPSGSAAESSASQAKHLSGQLYALPSHSGFTLIGCSFFLFEVVFLTLYGNDFWFSCDISHLGVAVLVLILLSTHFLLIWVESPWGCEFFSPIKRGLPLLVYRKWLKLGDAGFSFGQRHVLWAAIDELELTIFGNLLLKSKSICGDNSPGPDLLFKIPFSCVGTSEQKAFIDLVKQHRSGAVLNKRLQKCLSVVQVKAIVYVQLLGVVFMSMVLLDVAQSTFGFLQMTKEYYLAQVFARDKNFAAAVQHLEQADWLRQHPWFPYSWVNNKLLKQGTVAAGVAEARSEALWHLQRRPEAIEEARQACKLNGAGFRLHLRLARLLAATGQEKEARLQVRQAIVRHPGSLLPRLYMVALLSGMSHQQAEKFYDYYLDELRDQVFGDEPWWPPGGNRFLSEMFFQEDAAFVFDRLIKGKSPCHHDLECSHL